MAMETEEQAAPPPGASEITRGRGDEVAWMMLVSVVAFAALALGIVSLALYVSRDFGTASTGGGGGGAAPATSVSVETTEFAFRPSAWAVAAGQPISVTLTNKGAVEHEWVVLKAGVTIARESDLKTDDFLYRIPATAPGATATDSFTFEAGAYQVICAIAGHFDAGMKGQLSAS